jgi:hypothetical protein
LILIPIFAGLIAAATPELPVRSKFVNVSAPKEQPPAAISALTLCGTAEQTLNAETAGENVTTPTAKRKAVVILAVVISLTPRLFGC